MVPVGSLKKSRTFFSLPLLSLFLQKPLKSLHRRAIKIVLLKRTSLTHKDYITAQILPLSSRLMCNKARFVHKIVSGRAPIYLSKIIN